MGDPRAFVTAIYKAVDEGRLAEPFKAATVAAAVPGYTEYYRFLRKHSKGPETPRFIMLGNGYFRTTRRR
jgi:hypothetical protein